MVTTPYATVPATTSHRDATWLAAVHHATATWIGTNTGIHSRATSPRLSPSATRMPSTMSVAIVSDGPESTVSRHAPVAHARAMRQMASPQAAANTIVVAGPMASATSFTFAPTQTSYGRFECRLKASAIVTIPR